MSPPKIQIDGNVLISLPCQLKNNKNGTILLFIIDCELRLLDNTKEIAI